MTNSPISKNYEFLEEIGINLEELENPEDKIVFSYLVNQVDGISKMKQALESSISLEKFLAPEELSEELIEKYNLYRLWLLKHQQILIADTFGLEYTPASEDEELQNPRVAEAAAMFQSKQWQRKLWGKWASPPYEDS